MPQQTLKPGIRVRIIADILPEKYRQLPGVVVDRKPSGGYIWVLIPYKEYRPNPVPCLLRELKVVEHQQLFLFPELQE